ncbi:MAG: hypothetical protein J0M12_13100 [Deltaproteobacteria bacterium]|nr:hypothetical protein [Deltaproteobacteria bacterium]
MGSRAKHKCKSCRGASLVEMALLIGLIAVVCMIGVVRMGEESREALCQPVGGMERVAGPNEVTWREVSGQWCCARQSSQGWGGGTWVCM